MAKDKDMNEEMNAEEQVNATDSQSDENQNDQAVNNSVDPLTEAENKYNELNDRYVRLHAEFDNFRRRTNKEKIDIISSANAGVLKDLLPVLDDFERAIANNDKVDDLQVIREGFHLIFNKLRTVLESKGLKAMEAIGQPFDSELHEAIANMPAENKKDSGKVIDAVEKGYMLNDKVIRYAKVVVAQ